MPKSAATLALTQRAARGEAGLLRIGFGIASYFGLLPDVVLRFRRAHPDVQLQLRDMSTPDQIGALVRGEIDVGFVRHRDVDDRLAHAACPGRAPGRGGRPAQPWNTRAGLRSAASEPFIIIARVPVGQLLRPRAERLRAGGLRAEDRAGGERAVHVMLAGPCRSRRLAGPAVGRADAFPGVRFRELGIAAGRMEHRARLASRLERAPLVRRFVEAVPAAPVLSGRRVRRRG